jgi:3-isopropylmalate/(R)-2-methylmalate dehydratase small subunit
MEPFTCLTATAVAMSQENIDTDQIIPARFLTTTQKEGLGQHLFEYWRYDPAHAPRPEFVLNQPSAQGARILVAGDNFGCGSSREHAPWALADFGFRAVVSSSFADIFRNNSLKNGLLPVVVPPEVLRSLLSLLAEQPSLQLTINLESETLSAAGICSGFPIDPFSKICLLSGVDQLGYLLEQLPDIEAYEAAQAK